MHAVINIGCICWYDSDTIGIKFVRVRRDKGLPQEIGVCLLDGKRSQHTHGVSRLYFVSEQFQVTFHTLYRYVINDPEPARMGCDQSNTQYNRDPQGQCMVSVRSLLAHSKPLKRGGCRFYSIVEYDIDYWVVRSEL